MSKKLKNLSLLAIIISFASCQTTPSVDYVLLSGKIENPDKISYVTVKGENFSTDIDLNSDGTFSDTLRVEKGYYLFYSGRERTSIYLDKGYVLDLYIDQPQFDETLTYNGDGNGTGINNYLADKVRLDENITQDFQTLFSKEADQFIVSALDWQSKMNDLLNKAMLDDEVFAAMEKRNITYEFLTQFANYEYYHQFATKDWEYEAPASISDYLKDLDLSNEEDFKLVSNYKRMLQSYFGAMMQRGEIDKAFEAIRSISSSTIKDDLVPGYARQVEAGNEHAEAIYEGIMSLTSDSATIASLTDKIEKIRKLKKGMISPSFTYQSIDGNSVSLSDLRGKYVYIDVWATWCGPCIREIPALKQLESDFHNSPVEFVSISIDVEGDFEKWQNMVADKELKGIQLFADKDWQSDFVKAYAIDGIPRFIVIDDQGNIVDPNAARPSDPKIRELFESLTPNS